MNRRLITLLSLSAALMLVARCASKGDVQGTTLNPGQGKKLAIGYFENRHGGYRAFPVKNFIDMLEYEFMDQGYQVLDYAPRLLQDDDKNAGASEASRVRTRPVDENDPLLPGRDGTFSRSDGTDDLFPRNLRSIAGERGLKRRKKIRDHFLTAAEIKKLSGKLPFDYFIQGAVGTTERSMFGGAFDEEEDSLIFLKVYNREGLRVGAIRFFVDEKDYSQASFLTKVSNRIVENFSSELNSNVVAPAEPVAPRNEPAAPAAEPEAQPEERTETSELITVPPGGESPAP